MCPRAVLSEASASERVHAGWGKGFVGEGKIPSWLLSKASAGGRAGCLERGGRGFGGRAGAQLGSGSRVAEGGEVEVRTQKNVV